MTTQQTESHTPQQVASSVYNQNSATGCPTTSTNKLTAIRELQDYAFAHYEHGGDWVYECFDTADYQEVLDYYRGNMEIAKSAIKARWEALHQMEQEVQDY
jgi:hypothetical protein